MQDSNLRQPVCKTDTLPTELIALKLAGRRLSIKPLPLTITVSSLHGLFSIACHSPFSRAFFLCAVFIHHYFGISRLREARGGSTPIPEPPEVIPAKPWEPTEVQPKLPTLKMFVGTVELEVEQALTERQIQTGMMFRKTMTDKEGMLFVHGNAQGRGYWMNNVSVALSIAYLDPSGRIVEIHDMQPFNTNSVYSVSQNIQYALEVPQGWFKRKGVVPGAMVMTGKGTLPKTYFPNRR